MLIDNCPGLISYDASNNITSDAKVESAINTLLDSHMPSFSSATSSLIKCEFFQIPALK